MTSEIVPSRPSVKPMVNVVSEALRDARPPEGGSPVKTSFQPLAVMPPAGASGEVECRREFQNPAQSYLTTSLNACMSWSKVYGLTSGPLFRSEEHTSELQ